MPARRRELELSVERPVGPVGPAGTVARLTVKFETGTDGAGPSPVELKSALEQLLADLDAVVGVPLAGAPAGRPDREVTELVETYRPRQRELIDVLLADGELTIGEHRRLSEYLALRTKEPMESPAARPGLPAGAASLAAVPIAADRATEPVRPVAELLATYEITSLRQAGLVRARRQISFGEYMALKRHFEQESRSVGKPSR